MKRLQRAALSLCLAAIPGLVCATTTPSEPASVMFLGVFHFANPGADKVKTDVIDVMTAENQAYLEALATRLASFHPTDVLIECDPSEQGAYDRAFKDFRAGEFELTANENYQIGFRVAKLAGIDGVTCFNEDKIEWDAGPMFDYIAKNEPQTQARVEALFKSLTDSTQREQSTLTLPRLLSLANDPDRDRANKDLYLRTNGVGPAGNFVGADAAASWWHRNFRMYANVQRAAGPGDHVLVVAGQGHTAIMKDLLASDSQRQAEDVRGYLDAGDGSK